MEYYRSAYGGKGSTVVAGRFNRPGNQAVYAALDLSTAFAEFQRSLIGRPQPCVIVAARVRLRNAVDLTGDLSRCDPDIRDWNTDWEDARDLLNGGNLTADCASWRCFVHAVAEHRSGFVYPSILNPGGKNIVWFPADSTAGDVLVDVIDDDGMIGKAAKGVV